MLEQQHSTALESISNKGLMSTFLNREVFFHDEWNTYVYHNTYQTQQILYNGNVIFPNGSLNWTYTILIFILKIEKKKYKIRIHNCEKKNQIKYIYFGNSNLEVQYGPCVVLEKGLYVLSILIDKLQHFAIQIYFSLYNIYLPWKKKK